MTSHDVIPDFIHIIKDFTNNYDLITSFIGGRFSKHQFINEVITSTSRYSGAFIGQSRDSGIYRGCCRTAPSSKL